MSCPCLRAPLTLMICAVSVAVTASEPQSIINDLKPTVSQSKTLSTIQSRADTVDGVYIKTTKLQTSEIIRPELEALSSSLSLRLAAPKQWKPSSTGIENSTSIPALKSFSEQSLSIRKLHDVDADNELSETLKGFKPEVEIPKRALLLGKEVEND